MFKSRVKCPALLSVLFLLLLPLFAPQAWAAGSTTVVISQIYTAGGNSGATYNADYVELHNVGTTPVSLTGFALQYGSAAGTTASVIALTGGASPQPATITLQPGQYYLIQGTPSATNGVALPVTADQTLTGLAAGASAGKLYLTSTATALTATNICGGSPIVDFVGYGTTASCFEGTAAAPTPTTTVASIRAGSGCTDTDNNGADFSTGTPAPHNSSSTALICGGGGGTSTGITITGTANPSSVYQGSTTLLSVALTAGTNPASTGVAVTGNLSAFGGSSTQPFYDDGTHGDLTPGDSFYSYMLSVTNTAPLGSNTIAVSASDTQLRSATANIAVTVLAPVTLVPIHTIQGSTPGTAAYNGQTVMTSGIVTGVKVNGFYLQAKDVDADTNTATPEGIFVHTGTGSVPSTATVGTNMQVTGLVALYPTTGSLTPGTELDNPTAFTVLSTGNPLPTAITLTTTNPSATGGIYQFSKYQSMRIAVPSFTVTGPTEGVLTETAETYVSTGQFWGTVTGVPRPVREPGLEVLDAYTASQPSTIPRFDDNPELFQVDSVAMQPSPGPLDISTSTLMTNLTGVMDFAGGSPLLVIDATARPTVTGGLALTPVPVANAGELTVGDQNVERFYNTVKDTTGAVVVTQAAYTLRLAKASLAIRNVMRSPDIMAIEEMENIGNLQDLAAKISADAIAAGQIDPQYVAYLINGNDSSGINVAFLVNPNKVNVIDVSQFGKTTTTTGTSTLLNDRPPLVLHAGIKRASAADYPLTIIVNHLRSLNGVTDATTTGDNVRKKREQQAEFLANLTQGYQAAGEHVIVVGDLNAFEFSDGIVDSMGIIKGSAAPANQVVLAGPSGLVTPNLVDAAPTDLSKGAYSYTYLGNAQSIDHFYTTADIAGITRTAPAHYNADYPAVYRNDATRPEVSSDHDGIVGYIKIPGTTSLTITPASLTFATQVVKTTTTQTVAIKNNGTTAITVTNVVATGPFTTTNCGASIAAGATCTLTVSFTPTATGPVSGTITLTDSDVTGTQTIALSGTGAGIFSQVALAPATTNILTGGTVTLTATVTGNAGTTPTGTVNFVEGTTTLKTSTLASGVATFTTTTLAAGTHSITAVYSGDTTYPTSTSSAAAVIVTAPPVPDFTLSVSNLQVIATQSTTTATTTVDVAMTNGFSSTVSFTCTGLPASSRCSFSPASLTASGSSTLAVTINTTTAELHALPGFGSTGGVMACGLLALPFLLRRRTRTRLQRIGLAVALLLLSGGVAAMSGCGSHGGTTPLGTSTVTVTAAGGGVSHSATFTLKVQ